MCRSDCAVDLGFMDETLNRLLAAELEAERLVEEALAKKEQLTSEALADARRAEERFTARVPEIHGAFLDRAEGRASQTISELQRRYDERAKALRDMAETHGSEAVEAALSVLLDPDVD
jgi:V/A-type H+-transporting ATPase subunit G/H